MVGHVGHHALRGELLPAELTDPGALLLDVELERQGHHDLAGYLRVPAPLGRLGRIPELLPVPDPIGGLVRSNDLGVIDAGASAVVVALAGPLVDQVFAGSVGVQGRPLASEAAAATALAPLERLSAFALR